MTTRNPYSYVTQGGVANTQVKVAEDATLEDLAATKPVQLNTTAAEYASADKKTKTTIKKQLPYFVGGVLNGKRHDTAVQSRTLLTLDVEQGPHDEVPPSPEKVVAKLRDLGGAGWVYTSLSHTPSAPRYRVVLPLSGPLETGDNGAGPTTSVLRATTQAAAKRLGIEEWTQPESWVLSQAMYLPAKLRGGKFFQELVKGKAWKPRATDAPKKMPKPIADIPDERPDFVLAAIKHAGLYLKENPRHKGMHFITCPFADQHEAENDTQTVYYEAHFDGNPRPAVKCFDTAPDHDGAYHLTYATLVRYLQEHGHLSSEQQHQAGVLDDYDTFDAKSSLHTVLDTVPVPRTWAINQFAPTGKVTVLAGPGGVSKSMLLLHLLIHASTGLDWAEFKVGAPLRSLYVSYEDDRQELHSRVFTLAKALRDQDSGTFDVLYDVAGSIQRNVRMFAADDEAASWLLLTKPDRYAQPLRSERVEWLVGYIKAKGIKLLALDPAVYTHQLEENDIAAMATYMQTLTYIAKHADCAVVVLHHMNKTGGWAQLDDINQGSLRGASSFADNARSVAVVVSMPIRDAEAFGLPADHITTGRYAVLKHVKHNYSAPLPTMVFERKGPLLVHRPDITKLDKTVVKQAREAAVEQANQVRLRTVAMAALAYLVDMGPGCDASTAQVAHALKMKSNKAKEALQWLADTDYVEVNAAEKNGLANRFMATKTGRLYLKTARKLDQET